MIDETDMEYGWRFDEKPDPDCAADIIAEVLASTEIEFENDGKPLCEIKLFGKTVRQKKLSWAARHPWPEDPRRKRDRRRKQAVC